MHMEIKKDIDKPIYIQIKEQIENMILTNKILDGYLLPPERKLAAILGVNRSTVLKAYQDLKADGLVESHMGKGTFVAQTKPERYFNPNNKANEISWHTLFNKKFTENETIISNLMDFTSRNDIISFAGGMAAPDLYPVEEMEEIYKELFKTSSTDLFKNSAIEGYYPLRESIGKMLLERGIKATAREIMILSGSQQGLDYTAKIFLNVGDTVMVEEPTYLGAIQIFQSYGARIIGVPMDEQGICTDLLEAYIIRFKPKLIYTLPTYQNPTGIVMSMERRYKLLELAYKYQVPIIEDDPYGELRYEGDFIPSLKALDKQGHVIYLSTFSKTLFMGFRIGWTVAPSQVINKYSLMKQFTDLQANTPAQWVLDNFLRKGLYKNHLNRIQREYGSKRDIMDESLQKSKSYELQWVKPKGGFYIWCRLPDEIKPSALINKASKKGVAYVPGEVFYPNGMPDKSHIRLNYTYSKPDELVEGVKRLIESIDECMKERTEEVEFNKRPIV